MYGSCMCIKNFSDEWQIYPIKCVKILKHYISVYSNKKGGIASTLFAPNLP